MDLELWESSLSVTPEDGDKSSLRNIFIVNLLGEKYGVIN